MKLAIFTAYTNLEMFGKNKITYENQKWEKLGKNFDILPV